MNKAVLFLFLLVVPVLGFTQYASHDTTLLLMGTRFTLHAVGPAEQDCQSAVDAGIDEIRRIETLLSSHNAASQTTRINQAAGIKPVEVDRELFNLVQRSIKISQLTDGAFDITFRPLYQIWKFDGKTRKLPPADSILKYRSLVGYQHIELDANNSTVFLKKPGMSIGFGAIGKGYAANKAMKKMMEYGLSGGFVDASGDILFKGLNAKGEKWNVAIASPLDKKEIVGNIKVSDMAVVTSGNYEQFFIVDGKKYSHIIDPKSGYPVTETISVTVFTPDAEIADALATALSVLGVENGLKLVNQLRNTECLIIDSKGQLHFSSNLSLSKD